MTTRTASRWFFVTDDDETAWGGKRCWLERHLAGGEILRESVVLRVGHENGYGYVSWSLRIGGKPWTGGQSETVIGACRDAERRARKLMVEIAQNALGIADDACDDGEATREREDRYREAIGLGKVGPDRGRLT